MSGFASQGDTAEKAISFTEVGEGLYAFTAEGDPNSGVIIGDDSVMIVEAQATPRLARKVIDCVRSVTDKPISHLVLTHYHAVRVLGASAFGAPQVIMSDTARAMVAERGREDWDSEFARFPRLFEGHEEIPGLTWPTTTFSDAMTVYLGKRRVDIMHLGRAHTAGDAVVWVPDQEVMFTGDIVEYRSACYCGDGHFGEWEATLARIAAFGPKAIAPGRGDALVGPEMVAKAIESTADFVRSTYAPAARVAARGGSLKEAWDAVRAECDPKFSDYAIYEHCLPFNVARAHDEARGIAHPRIWTAERDREMWEALATERGQGAESVAETWRTMRAEKAQAFGRETEEGFLVRAGSTAMRNGSPNVKRDRPLRDELVRLGVLAEDGDPQLYRFTRDHEFTSASASAGVVKDGNASGPGLWK